MVTERIGLPGVVVLRVSAGSAAERAGLRGVRRTADGGIVPGDIIVAVDGTAVESVARLLIRLDDHQVGETVLLTVLRGEQKTRRERDPPGGQPVVAILTTTEPDARCARRAEESQITLLVVVSPQ